MGIIQALTWGLQLHIHTSTKASNFRGVLYNTGIAIWKYLSDVSRVERLNSKGLYYLNIKKKSQKESLPSTSPEWKHSLFLLNPLKWATNGWQFN